MISISAGAFSLLLGVIVGILIVIDVRARNGLGPNGALAVTGVLFGAIMAWTILDTQHLLEESKVKEEQTK